MPTYTCEKCARVFKQKSGFNDHIAKKNDCSKTVVIDAIVASKVEEKVKEVVRATQQKPDITKETLPAFFEDLHNLLWNKAGLNPERALEHMTFFFAYRLIEQQADTLSLPQECRWSFIASLKNENDLFETIKKGVSEFRKRPKTKAFFKPHEIQKADIVYEIVQQINRISLKILQETDTLGDIFEYMLGRGMSTMSDEGQYFTNRAICKLAFKLAYDIKKNLRRADGTLCTFADWFCGTGGFPAEFVKGVKGVLGDAVDWKKDSASVYCQDMNLSSVTTTLLNMLILTGIPFSGEKIRGSNSFTDAITSGAGAPFNGLTIDYCFMNPPYGGDKSKGKEYKFAYSKKVKAEDGSTSKKFFVNHEIQSIGIEDDDKVSAGVQLAMATLSADGGVCSIVLPQGFFFGASKKCVELRKKIAEEYKIWYVVDIASGAFANTGTKTSMMVFQKGSTTDKVAFIGLDEKLLVEATLEELRAKNYSFNYKQYLPQSAVEVEGYSVKKLSDIASDITFGFMVSSNDYGVDGVPVIKTKNIKAKSVEYPAIDQKITRTLDEKYRVKKGDMLVVLGGSPGEHGIWNYTETAWLNQDCAKISIDNEITKKFVFYMLGSPLVKAYIESNTTKTTIGHISRGTVRDIPISLPSLERQQQIVEAIDGWASLAQQEEVALKILEKQMMFQVKEMGRGQARVKLGEVCEIRNGKALTKEDLTGGDVPVIGGGVSPMGYHNTYNKEPYTVVLAQIGANAGNVSRYSVKSWITNNGMTIHPKGNSIINDDVLYYLLKNIQDDIKGFAEGTAQPKLSSSSVLSLEVQLPPLAEQQTLQSDFDEIRHKHAKIAVYKAKAQEAIQRLIPGAIPV
jgi:type I restriction enzyme S subunit